jgi:hypothetical protein
VKSLPNKRRILEKKREKEKKEREKKKKAKGGKKQRVDEIISCWERFYRKKERKQFTFSYSAKSDVWPHPYQHVIFICTIFYSLTFPLPPFTTPFSINHYYLPHKLSRIFLCFDNIQGVA